MRDLSQTMEEIKLLNQFNLESRESGIKVHAQHASDAALAAAERLFAKGLTDRGDGGYLTERGLEAALHAQAVLRLLSE